MREGHLYIVFHHNVTHQLYFEYLFYVLHYIHDSRWPGTIWLPVVQLNWLLWSCQADCLSLCLSVGLSDWLPWSRHADYLTPEQTNADLIIWHMIAHWQPLFSQQASGPLLYIYIYIYIYIYMIYMCVYIYIHTYINSFSKTGNKWHDKFQKKNQLYSCRMISARLVEKHPVVINTENRFTVNGKLEEWQSHKDVKWIKFNHQKTKEWMYNNPLQEIYGPVRWIKHNLELRWALSKMYEHHLTFNSRVNMRPLVFKQRFCYIEMINLTLKSLSHPAYNTFLT